jgi:hypothetical protein
MGAVTTRAQTEQARIDNAAALAARDGELFGNYLEDVRFLRTRDFQIQRENTGFVVDGKSVDAATLRALADRERRLSGSPSTLARDPVDAGAQARRPHAARRPRRSTKPPAPKPAPVAAAPAVPKKPMRLRLARQPKPPARHASNLIPAAEVLAIVRQLHRLLDQVERLQRGRS